MERLTEVFWPVQIRPRFADKVSWASNSDVPDRADVLSADRQVTCAAPFATDLAYLREARTGESRQRRRTD
jgi:hypothetical protein